MILSYGFYLIFFIGTLLPAIFYGIYGVNLLYANRVASNGYSYGENAYLPLLLNPVVYLTEFFTQIMTGESLVNEISDLSVTAKVRGPIRYVTQGPWWMIVSTVLFVAVSFLFLWFASRRIDPMKSRAVMKKGRRI